MISEGDLEPPPAVVTPADRHRCKWPDCREVIPASRYACQGHWYKIPLALRVSLNRAWTALQRIRNARGLDRTPRLHGTRSPAAARQALTDCTAAAATIQEWIRVHGK